MKIRFYVLIFMLLTGITNAYGGENASNPLADVHNTSTRYQYFDLDGSEKKDLWLDGAYRLSPKLIVVNLDKNGKRIYA